MINISKAIIFSIAVLGLSLIVFPAAAQIEPVTGPCGFANCDKAAGKEVGLIITVINSYVIAFALLIEIVATLFLLYAAFKYITSGGNEEATTQAKRQIVYAIIGIAIGLNVHILALSFLVRDATVASSIIRSFVDAGLYLVTTVAGIFVVYAGYKYITSGGNEEETTKAKSQLIYAIVGLIVAALVFVIVDNVTQIPGGRAPDELRDAARNIINGLLLFMSVIAGASIIYGGYKYISSQGNEESVDAAKKTIIYSIIGIIVIALSAAIVNFFLNTTGVLP